MSVAQVLLHYVLSQHARHGPLVLHLYRLWRVWRMGSKGLVSWVGTAPRGSSSNVYMFTLYTLYKFSRSV